MGFSPRGRQESDTTEQLNNNHKSKSRTDVSPQGTEQESGDLRVSNAGHVSTTLSPTQRLSFSPFAQAQPNANRDHQRGELQMFANCEQIRRKASI